MLNQVASVAKAPRSADPAAQEAATSTQLSMGGSQWQDHTWAKGGSCRQATGVEAPGGSQLGHLVPTGCGGVVSQQFPKARGVLSPGGNIQGVLEDCA